MKEDDDATRPSPLLVVSTVIVVALNVLRSTGQAKAMQEGAAYVAGFVFAQAVLIPLVILGLFQIGRAFRSARNRWRIVLWSEVFIIVTQILGRAGQA